MLKDEAADLYTVVISRILYNYCYIGLFVGLIAMKINIETHQPYPLKSLHLIHE